MKKLLLLIIILIAGRYCYGTVFQINVQNFQFTPSSIPNVIVGDIIQFNWVNGSHTTTCDPNASNLTSLPAGAQTWNTPMSSSSTSFSYTVTKPGTYNYVCIPHSPNMKGSFFASNALPVILTSFAVSKAEGKALIKWSTSSEENSNYFSVRKSYSGSDFNEIAMVPAAGNSTETRNYSYVDNLAADDKHQFAYYLIAIVDKDGKSNFSPTAMLTVNSQLKKMILSLTPNPVNKGGHLMVDFNADGTDNMKVAVTSVDGKSVLTTEMAAHKGVNMGHIHVGDLPPGTYIVKFSMHDNEEHFMIVVK